MKLKKYLYLIIIFCIITVLPVYAVKWVDSGDGLGIKTGISYDIDAINSQGNQMTLVVKYTNDRILQSFSYLDAQRRPLSVCLLQATINCSNEMPTSFAMLCYDKTGQIVVDSVDPNIDITKYTKATSNLQNNTFNCNEIKNLKNGLSKFAK